MSWLRNDQQFFNNCLIYMSVCKHGDCCVTAAVWCGRCADDAVVVWKYWCNNCDRWSVHYLWCESNIRRKNSHCTRRHKKALIKSTVECECIKVICDLKNWIGKWTNYMLLWRNFWRVLSPHFFWKSYKFWLEESQDSQLLKGVTGDRRYKCYRKWRIRVPDWLYLPEFLQRQQGAERLVFE